LRETTNGRLALPDQPRGSVGGLSPYLNLEGASAASAFYQKAFGAKELFRNLADDGQRLLHCHLEINGASLLICDWFPEWGMPKQAPQAFTLHLQVEDVDAWWARAVEAGCTVAMPLDLQFWGDRYGKLLDPFGVGWSLAQTVA
jgi:PhnB protein